MSVYTVADFQRASGERIAEIDRELAEIQQRAQQNFQRKNELQQRKDQAELELVTQLLPSFTREGLERARNISGFQPLNDSLIDRMNQERQELQSRVAQIETDPRYYDRERLRNPDTGELTLALQRLEEHRTALSPMVDKARSVKRMDHLIEVGYGTPAYKVGFWRLSYYLDWKAGDEVMELFPGRKSFAALREEYLENKRALDDLEPRRQELLQEIDAGVGLEADYNLAKARLQNLEQLHLDAARKSLAQFLADCPEGALGTRLQRHPELETMAKRWAGVSEQLRYLERVSELQLNSLVADLNTEKGKLQKDRVKFSRPKNSYQRFTQQTWDSRFGGRREKVRKRLDRYGHTVETIYVFDDYDRGSLAENFLWWDLVTDGQVDGNFIPEVQEYYRRHPGYQYQRKRRSEVIDDTPSYTTSSTSTFDAS